METLAEFIATMRTGIDPNGQELSKQMPWAVRSDEWRMRNSPPFYDEPGVCVRLTRMPASEVRRRRGSKNQEDCQ